MTVRLDQQLKNNFLATIPPKGDLLNLCLHYQFITEQNNGEHRSPYQLGLC